MTTTETVYLARSSLLRITVKVGNRHMMALVDSCASVSILNAKLADASDIHSGRVLRVQGYDGKVALHMQWASVTIEFQGHKFDSEVLVIEGVIYDFLLSRPDIKKLKINVYWDDAVLVERLPRNETKEGKQDDLRVVKCAADIEKAFPELVCVGNYPPAMTSHKVPFELTNKTAIRKSPYNMLRERKMWLKKEVQEMLDADIIRPSVSPFASSITIVPKEDGTFRLCTDYRALNRQIDLIPFAMPNIATIIGETGGCQHFSRIDLCKGFWQIPLTEETKMYTAFITPFDLYEYNRIPFGWKNSPAWFQKIMNEVLKP